MELTLSGFALRGSSEDGFCDDSEWLELFNGCLDCALEFDIWRHYGNGLTPAAESCGLDATPKPADGGDDEGEATTSAEEVATETSAADTTTVEVTATEESTVATATATATEEASSAWTSSVAHTESHSEGVTLITTATWTSTHVPTGTGSLNTVCASDASQLESRLTRSTDCYPRAYQHPW